MQLAEALPGSVSAMMRAAGYKNEKDFFKAVEAGKIMASEVMPKFADELKKVANANGALGEVTKKTRAELNRFLNQLTYAKDEIFQGGMDDGLSALFGTLADTLENLKPIAKVIGALFKGVVSVLTGAFKLLITPIEIVTQSIADLWGMLGADGGVWGQKIWSLVGAGGVLALLAMRFKFIQNVIFGANATLIVMMKNLARIAIPLLAIEDIWGGMQGKRSATGQGGAWSAEGLFGKSFAWMDKPIGSYFGETKVVVEVRGDAAAKFITTTVEKNNQQRSAISQMETSQ